MIRSPPPCQTSPSWARSCFPVLHGGGSSTVRPGWCSPVNTTSTPVRINTTRNTTTPLGTYSSTHTTETIPSGPHLHSTPVTINTTTPLSATPLNTTISLYIHYCYQQFNTTPLQPPHTFPFTSFQHHHTTTNTSNIRPTLTSTPLTPPVNTG